MNLPNWITVGRMALVAPFVFLSYRQSDASAIAAFVLFGIASMTDQLDGYLARKRNAVTRAGQFLDPLADKLLIGAALVVLVDARDFPLWAALLIGAREIAVQAFRVQVVRAGGTLPASPSAKLKTVFQIALVAWWLLPWEQVNLGHALLLSVALVTTWWSGLEYFLKANRIKEVVP